MIYATFPTSGMYGVLSCMLHQLGHDVTDEALVRSIHLPLMMTCEDGVFRSGTSLCTPDWLDRALGPFGYHAAVETVPAESLCTRLSELPVAALELQVSKNLRRIVVCCGYAEKRWHFINIRMANSREPEEFLFTPGQVKKAAAEQVQLLTLKPCEPHTADIKPLLVNSYHTLSRMHAELASLWEARILRPQQIALEKSHFQALLGYTMALAHMIDDPSLYNDMYQFRRGMRCILYGNMYVAVMERFVHQDQLDACINALQEQIIDRLCYLGVSDRQLTKLMNSRTL